MIWSNFIYYNVGSLLPIEGMMNSEKYLQVLDKKRSQTQIFTRSSEICKIVRENAFPDGSGIFQQDSPPCHKVMK